MMPELASKVALNASSGTAGSTATALIDRMVGDDMADWMTIDVIATTADVVSNSPTVLKLQECDTTVASSFVDVVGFRGGTDFTIPAAVTAATAAVGNAYKFNVDCRGRKRYLRVLASPATTQSITVVANLARIKSGAPITAAKAGVALLVEG